MIPRVQAPTTAKTVTSETRLTNTRNDIWIQSHKPHFQYDFPIGFAANKVRLSPRKTSGGDDIFIIPFRVLDADGDCQDVIVYDSIAWDIDLSQAGINLGTLTGGRVDGIAQEANRIYLLWGFYDPSLGSSGFSGFGVTRKPYSTFSAVATGTKGSTATLTVTNGFQFTIGARVVVRNTVGTAPLYEYNQGTIVNIVSSTSITVLMDNVAGYGTNITAATNGEVEQWDKFKPWIVGASSQTLYKNSYSLLGELYTTGTNILRAYSVDNEYREALSLQVFNTAAVIAAPTAVVMLRYLPLWVEQAALKVILNPSALAVSMSITVNGSQIMFIISSNPAYTAAGNFLNTGYVFLEKYAQVTVTKNNAINGFIYILGYRVPGGMRL